MAGDVLFTNGFTMAWGGYDVMNPDLVDIVDQDVISYEIQGAQEVMTKMGYVKQEPINPNLQISVKVGARELKETVEGELIPLGEPGKGPNKTTQVTIFSEKRLITKLAYDWVKSNQFLGSANPSTQQAVGEMAEGMRDLKKGLMLSKAIQATRVFTLGFAVTQPYWPGSATPDGNSLFDTDHVWNDGVINGTFGNVLGSGGYGTLNAVFSATQLQAMLDIQKTILRLRNGHKTFAWPEYKLHIPRELAVAVRTVLNTASDKAGPWSGTGSNANEVNTFYFQGNRVELVENPFIGYQTDELGTLGAITNYYLVNSYGAVENRALRYLELNWGEFEIWYDENTKNRYSSLWSAFQCDHFGAESFITASQGTVTP